MHASRGRQIAGKWILAAAVGATSAFDLGYASAATNSWSGGASGAGSLNWSTSAVTGQAYPIVTATGSAVVSLATIFANLPENTVYDQGQGIAYKLNYSSGQVDLTFIAVPEPGSVGLILAGGVGALLRRRRRT